jgi:hypothetical protein
MLVGEDELIMSEYFTVMFERVCKSGTTLPRMVNWIELFVVVLEVL